MSKAVCTGSNLDVSPSNTWQAQLFMQGIKVDYLALNNRIEAFVLDKTCNSIEIRWRPNGESVTRQTIISWHDLKNC